jgi:hypothetical protein
MNGRLILAASVTLLLVAGSAGAAQPWLQDRRYGEGIGIQAGRFELHPGVSAEFGYDSNFFLRAENEHPADAFRLRVTPSLSLRTVTPRRAGSEAVGAAPMFNFRANTYFAYSEVFGSKEVSDQRNFDAGVGGALDIAPARPFGGDVYADFVRNGEPSNLAGTGQTFDRGTVRGGAGVTWRPGGGLFEWRLGYEASYAYFEDSPYTVYNNLTHSVVTRGRWRILPRSGFLYDATYQFLRYQHSPSPQPDGDSLQARVGFSGLVTSRVAFLVMGGWRSTFYEANGSATPINGAVVPATPARNYDGLVGQAELKFFFSEGPDVDSAPTGLSSVAIGALHDVNNSYLGAFYTRDRGYLSFDMFLGGVFVANLQGGFSHNRYPPPDTTLNPMGFSQNHVDAQLFAEYRFSDTFGLNSTLLYDQSIGEGPYPQGVLLNPATGAYDNLEYQRFQASVGVRLFW